MAKFLVKFECLVPVEADTIIEADNSQEVISILEQNEPVSFHFKTIGGFKDIREMKIEKVEE